MTIKKQVFELLSALCVYNADGYNRALDALEHYKVCGHVPRICFVVSCIFLSVFSPSSFLFVVPWDEAYLQIPGYIAHVILTV